MVALHSGDGMESSAGQGSYADVYSVGHVPWGNSEALAEKPGHVRELSVRGQIDTCSQALAEKPGHARELSVREQIDKCSQELAKLNERCGSLLGDRGPERARTGVHPDQQLAAFEELVLPVVQAQHLESQQAVPTAEALTAKLPSRTRTMVICKLLPACESMHVSEEVVHAAVLLMDRFFALSPTAELGGWFWLVILAAVSIAQKMIGTRERGSAVNELRAMDLMQQMWLHLMQGAQVSPACLAQAEHNVLEALSWEVSSPSPLDILNTILGPDTLCSGPGAPSIKDPAVRCMARKLLKLSLVDVQLHYRYPHVVLAVSAITLSLNRQQAPQSSVESLLLFAEAAFSKQDAGAVTAAPDTRDEDLEVLRCELRQKDALIEELNRQLEAARAENRAFREAAGSLKVALPQVSYV